MATLTGLVIGTSGSWQNKGDTADKAFTPSGFFDGPDASGDWCGLDLGSAYRITTIGFTPRHGYESRAAGGVFQGSDTADFASHDVLYTIPSPAPTGFQVVAAVDVSPHRYVRYIGPANGNCNIGGIAFVGLPASSGDVLPGTKIGTAGSWHNLGHVIANAFVVGDYFDAPTASGNWVGLDLGTAMAVSGVTYTPRVGFAGRLTGGTFQGSNTADFAAHDVLGTIADGSTAPGFLEFAGTGTYRYVRYVGPENSYCNIGGLKFIGTTTAVVTPTPTPTPSETGAFKIGLGSQAIAGTNLIVGEAPCVVWVDATGLGSVVTDDFKWNFGDADDIRPDYRHQIDQTYPATFNTNTDMTGGVEAHLYNTPGSYPITLSLVKADGSTVTSTQVVVVQASTRQEFYFDAVNGLDSNSGAKTSPFKTGAKYLQVAGKKDSHVYILPGKYDVVTNNPSRLQANCVVEGVPDASGNLPVINILGGSLHDGWPGQTDGAIIRNIKFTSPSTDIQRGGMTCHSANGWVLTGRGRNIALVDCTFDTLLRFSYWMGGGDGGHYVLGCRQLDPVGVFSQIISQWSNGMVCWVGNYITGSLTESPTRSDGAGTCDGYSYEFNYVANTYPQVIDKATLTNRNANNGMVANNTFVTGCIGASVTIGSTVTQITSLSYRRNLVMDGGWTIGARTHNMSFLENDIRVYNSPGMHFAVTAAQGVTGITIKGNKGPGNNYGIYGGSTSDIQGWSSDAPAGKTPSPKAKAGQIDKDEPNQVDDDHFWAVIGEL